MVAVESVEVEVEREVTGEGRGRERKDREKDENTEEEEDEDDSVMSPSPSQSPPSPAATAAKVDEKDLEKGDMGHVVKEVEEEVRERNSHVAMLQRLNPSNPLRIAINTGTRVASPFQPPIPTSQPSRISLQSRSTPTPHHSLTVTTLNSTKYTNKISLLLFMFHMVAALGFVCFLIFKGVQGLTGLSNSVKRKEKRIINYFLPQVEAAALLSITLAFVWQTSIRKWPTFMVHFIIWSTFVMSLTAGILLICFQKPSTDGVGVCFIGFSIGSGLYACWVNQRIKFCCKVLVKSLEPVSKFPDLNQPTYWMLGVGFVWMSAWILAVIGALNFHLSPLIIIAMILSLAWTAEVIRNVVNLTVSRVIALYYLRGMQSSTQFCFQRALTRNLGSACLGSLFLPSIEALRIVARGLNLLEGEDEFMFSCAHCCLNVMQAIFRYGNSWAFVQVAAYGKGFVQASQDTWEVFEREEMEPIVDSDITSSVCFLSGVCSGSVCVILVAVWTAKVHQPFTATISLLAFFIGYLMTRISMALPHASVSCYYVCYGENPENRLFDKTIKERLSMMKSGRDVVVPTPRVPRRFLR